MGVAEFTFSVKYPQEMNEKMHKSRFKRNVQVEDRRGIGRTIVIEAGRRYQ